MADVEGLEAVPVVNVRDIDMATNFYVDQLGFEKVFAAGPYVGVRFGLAVIHLNGGHDRWNARPTSVRVTIRGIEAYHRELDALSLVMDDERLQQTSVGHRQFSVLDPSENRITFVQFET